MAPIFLASALDSGLALLIIVLLALDRYTDFNLDKKLLPKMATLLAVFVAVDLFLFFMELLTVYWPAGETEVLYLNALLNGPYSGFFWYEVLIGGLLPFAILAIPRLRSSAPAVVVSSALIVTGILAKRVNLLMPGFYYPNIDYGPGITIGTIPPGATVPYPTHVFALLGTYFPTWVEIAIVVGVIALGALIITIGSKIIPLNEPAEEETEETAESVLTTEKQTVAGGK
jgi:molybdopterin-containing oxidoreductase family membrane subunit